MAPMMLNLNFVVFVVVLHCRLMSSSYATSDKAKNEICTNPKYLDVNQEFLNKLGGNGFYIPMHKSFESFISKATDPKDDVPMNKAVDTNKFELERCFDMVTKTNYGKFFIAINCKVFNGGNRHKCGVISSTPMKPENVPKTPPQVPSSPSQMIFIMDGTFQYTKTDNSTYVLITGCLTRMEPVWLVLTGEPDLKKSTKEDILKHLVKLGFKNDEVSTTSDPVIFEKLEKSDCNSNTSMPNSISAFFAGLNLFNR